MLRELAKRGLVLEEKVTATGEEDCREALRGVVERLSNHAIRSR